LVQICNDKIVVDRRSSLIDDLHVVLLVSTARNHRGVRCSTIETAVASSRFLDSISKHVCVCCLAAPVGDSNYAYSCLSVSREVRLYVGVSCLYILVAIVASLRVTSHPWQIQCSNIMFIELWSCLDFCCVFVLLCGSGDPQHANTLTCRAFACLSNSSLSIVRLTVDFHCAPNAAECSNKSTGAHPHEYACSSSCVASESLFDSDFER